MTPTNTEALAALSYAEAAKLLANELDYKYQRGIDPHDGEWRNAVTLLHSLSAVEAERDALRADAERWRVLLLVDADHHRPPEHREHPKAYEAYNEQFGAGFDRTTCVDAARAAMKGTQA